MFDISSYLPNDTYSYELLFEAEFHHSVSSGNTLYILLNALNNADTRIPFIYSSTYAHHQHNMAIVPIGVDRELGFITDDTGFSSATINLIGYRRIGTNA